MVSRGSPAPARRRARWMAGLVALLVVLCLTQGGAEARSLAALSKGTQIAGIFEEAGHPVPEVMKRMFKGCHDQNIDRVMLENLDTRVDGPAFKTVVRAVEKELLHKEKSREEFDMYHECLIMPAGKSRPTEECMDGDSFKGGRLLTSVAIEALHNAGLHGAYEMTRYIIRQMTQGNGFKFSKLQELRLKEAEAFSHGDGASLLKFGPHLHLETICRECLESTLQKLTDLGERPDQEKVSALSQDMDKWATTLRCAASSSFPNCLPFSVYKVYQCNQQRQEPNSGSDDDDDFVATNTTAVATTAPDLDCAGVLNLDEAVAQFEEEGPQQMDCAFCAVPEMDEAVAQFEEEGSQKIGCAFTPKKRVTIGEKEEQQPSCDTVEAFVNAQKALHGGKLPAVESKHFPLWSNGEAGASSTFMRYLDSTDIGKTVKAVKGAVTGDVVGSGWLDAAFERPPKDTTPVELLNRCMRASGVVLKALQAVDHANRADKALGFGLSDDVKKADLVSKRVDKMLNHAEKGQIAGTVKAAEALERDESDHEVKDDGPVRDLHNKVAEVHDTANAFGLDGLGDFADHVGDLSDTVLSKVNQAGSSIAWGVYTAGSAIADSGGGHEEVKLGGCLLALIAAHAEMFPPCDLDELTLAGLLELEIPVDEAKHLELGDGSTLQQQELAKQVRGGVKIGAELIRDALRIDFPSSSVIVSIAETLSGPAKGLAEMQNKFGTGNAYQQAVFLAGGVGHVVALKDKFFKPFLAGADNDPAQAALFNRVRLTDAVAGGADGAMDYGVLGKNSGEYMCVAGDGNKANYCAKFCSVGFSICDVGAAAECTRKADCFKYFKGSSNGENLQKVLKSELEPQSCLPNLFGPALTRTKLDNFPCKGCGLALDNLCVPRPLVKFVL